MADIQEKYGVNKALEALQVERNTKGTSAGGEFFGSGNKIDSYSPVDGEKLGTVATTSAEDYNQVITNADAAFKEWRKWPAPQRGDVIRQFNDELRRLKPELGKLVSYEMGKSYQEGLGEVQEMIDICDFAVGLSRQLHGLTMHSERPGHRMYEQWHPLGVVGIISAFNFPVAVWSWNTAIAWACGNACIWKGSEKTPLTSIACQKIATRVFEKNGVPRGVSSLITGDAKVGEYMTTDDRVRLVSATGSIRMGKIVAQTVAKRLGKSLLELGGNNAIIITPEADIKNTVVGAVFGAVGTCGQRCTSTRRLIIHEDVYDQVKDALVDAYQQLKIGNPLDENNHVGPLIDKDSVDNYLKAIKRVKEEGGNVLVEGSVLSGDGFESGCYVKPSIAEADNHFDIVQEETFGPILYLIKYTGEIDNAIELQNGVVQGLSSALMSTNLREAEQFLSAEGSDCGIANVNIGTSGAEIGGAFGGEKETGGGRESGSDAWKAYMRRQTTTINYTKEIPLAQGIKFDL